MGVSREKFGEAILAPCFSQNPCGETWERVARALHGQMLKPWMVSVITGQNIEHLPHALALDSDNLDSRCTVMLPSLPGNHPWFTMGSPAAILTYCGS